MRTLTSQVLAQKDNPERAMHAIVVVVTPGATWAFSNFATSALTFNSVACPVYSLLEKFPETEQGIDYEQRDANVSSMTIELNNIKKIEGATIAHKLVDVDQAIVYAYEIPGDAIKAGSALITAIEHGFLYFKGRARARQSYDAKRCRIECESFIDGQWPLYPPRALPVNSTERDKDLIRPYVIGDFSPSDALLLYGPGLIQAAMEIINDSGDPADDLYKFTLCNGLMGNDITPRLFLKIPDSECLFEVTDGYTVSESGTAYTYVVLENTVTGFFHVSCNGTGDQDLYMGFVEVDGEIGGTPFHFNDYKNDLLFGENAYDHDQSKAAVLYSGIDLYYAGVAHAKGHAIYTFPNLCSDAFDQYVTIDDDEIYLDLKLKTYDMHVGASVIAHQYSGAPYGTSFIFSADSPENVEQESDSHWFDGTSQSHKLDPAYHFATAVGTQMANNNARVDVLAYCKGTASGGTGQQKMMEIYELKMRIGASIDLRAIGKQVTFEQPYEVNVAHPQKARGHRKEGPKTRWVNPPPRSGETTVILSTNVRNGVELWWCGGGNKIGSTVATRLSLTATDVNESIPTAIENLLRDEMGFTDADIDLVTFDAMRDATIRGRFVMDGTNRIRLDELIRKLAENANFIFYYDSVGRARLISISPIAPTNVDRTFVWSQLRGHPACSYTPTERIINRFTVRHDNYRPDLTGSNDYRYTWELYDTTSETAYGTRTIEASFEALSGDTIDDATTNLAKMLINQFANPHLVVAIKVPPMYALDLEIGDWFALDPTTVDPHELCYGASWSGKKMQICRKRYRSNVIELTGVMTTKVYAV